MTVQLLKRNDVLASVCRESFEEFVRAFWECVPGAGTLIWSWHIGVFCEELQKIAERVFRGEPKEYDLVVNVSPGTSKSSVFSILFHPWTWTRMPSARHLNASHTAELVLDFGAKSRDVIRSEKYRECFPEIVLSEQQDAKGYYRNTLGGDRLACTVAGKSPMGFHGHFLSCDDPIDPKRAVSEAETQTAKEFMTNVLPTRKVNKLVSVTTLIMQRLGREDPTAVMLDVAKKEGAPKVRHICLPAEESDDIKPPGLRRFYVDGLMDPVRLPRSFLNEQKILQGAYGYAGQFMQCLVRGTMVATKRGLVPIELITADDAVLTREGWKKVLWAGRTGITNRLSSVLFSNGAVLVGTGNHPVWCEGIGWVPIDALGGGMYNTILPKGELLWADQGNQRRSAFDSTARISIEARTKPTSVGLKEEDGFTASYGFTTTGASPLATTSITRTATRLIIELKILNASLRESMACGMPTARKSVVNFLLRSANSLGLGTKARKARSTIKRWVANLSSSCGTTPPIEIILAADAAGYSVLERSVTPNPCTVQGSARRKTASVCMPRSVFGVITDSQLQILESQPALDLVRLDGGGQGVEVFDVTVEDAHEFFAEGVLVHNSPMPLGGGMFKLDYFSRRVKAAPYHAKRVRFWDRAATMDGGCYTAGVLMSHHEGNFYVEHAEHGQWEPDERNRRMRAVAMRDRARYGPKNEPAVDVEREGGSSGRDAWLAVARALVGFNVREVTVTGSKDARAEPWACQCASGTVYLVDDGTWDVEGYIQEHCLFRPEPGKRLGKFKDLVDASSGGFNRLIGTRSPGTVRVLGGHKSYGKKIVRFVICSRQELANTVFDDKAILVSIQDPAPKGDGVLPGHGVDKLMDSLVVQFADLDSAEIQAKVERDEMRWNDPIPPYDKTVTDLVLTTEIAKKIWVFALKKRDPPFEICIIQDEGDGDRRALSIAFALCDALRLPRSQSVCVLADNDYNGDGVEAPNQHAFDVMRSSRAMVIA